MVKFEVSRRVECESDLVKRALYLLNKNSIGKYLREVEPIAVVREYNASNVLVLEECFLAGIHFPRTEFRFPISSAVALVTYSRNPRRNYDVIGIHRIPFVVLDYFIEYLMKKGEMIELIINTITRSKNLKIIQ